MTQVKFTWDDARATFDKLYKHVNEWSFEADIFNKRLAIVIFNHTHGFFWLEDGKGVEDDGYITIWTGVYARDFYKAPQSGVYERRPIGESVKYLYNRVNYDIESKVTLDDLHKENKVKNQVSLGYWDPHKWDRSSYVAPVVNYIDGYPGVPGWEGSKVSQLADAQGDVLGLLRKELNDAIDAGYIPNDLNATIRKYQGMAKPKFILTMTFNVKLEDVLDDLVDEDNPYNLISPYRELYDRIRTIFNAFNYKKSNSQVGHIDSVYTGKIVINFLD